MDQYKPAAKTLSRIKDVDFVGVVGISGAGKSTIMAAANAQDPKLQLAVVTTTRPARQDEQDGVDVHVRAQAEVQARAANGDYLIAIPNMLAWYALDPADCPPGIVLMPIIAQSVPMYGPLPFRSFRTICILPPSYQEWSKRWSRRKLAPAQIESRLEEARTSLRFAMQSDGPFVINDDLAHAVAEFVRIVRGKTPNVPAARGRALAASLLKQL